ncbi:uncharacterized protein LOC108046167 [Drosophila rhopaloa]|uniref:Uncharacterized protein LOC108046167 n=1 Tax=Drosophila rhopaloa TaxID=1041015 RepID=A0A6P4F781_DRORH|nr:uncharacterized protein LOC108046167 [Drosophila rhopaloa]
MNCCGFWIWELLILFEVVNLSIQVKFEFVLDDDSVYSDCSDAPPGILNIDAFFDRSNLSTIMVPQGIQMSGNITSVFNSQASDRVEMTASLLHYERGFWQPTTLNIKVKDFCAVMYDEKQLWYKPWSSHITNRKEIEDKCFSFGTVYVMENYTMELGFGSGIPLPVGRYSVRVEVYSIDKSEQRRPHGICYELIGNFYKI